MKGPGIGDLGVGLTRDLDSEGRLLRERDVRIDSNNVSGVAQSGPAARR